jgi:hypothetical protein
MKQLQQFFDTRRLVGARNALFMILIASFYIDYQVCIGSRRKALAQYRQFIQRLARRMQRQAYAFVFLEKDRATLAKLEYLLTWRSTV